MNDIGRWGHTGRHFRGDDSSRGYADNARARGRL